MQPRFRAIDPETGKVYTCHFDLTDVSYFKRPYKGVWEIEIEGLTPNNKPPILSQSTGLTDSRGREIYEHDVIFRPAASKLVEVIYRDGCYWLVDLGEDTLLHRLNWLGETARPAFVVGNRYMSPDTLRARAEGGGE